MRAEGAGLRTDFGIDIGIELSVLYGSRAELSTLTGSVFGTRVWCADRGIEYYGKNSGKNESIDSI